jgi:hypothetical protein
LQYNVSRNHFLASFLFFSLGDDNVKKRMMLFTKGFHGFRSIFESKIAAVELKLQKWLSSPKSTKRE